VVFMAVPDVEEEESGSATLHSGPSALASVHAHTSHTCACEASADKVARYRPSPLMSTCIARKQSTNANEANA